MDQNSLFRVAKTLPGETIQGYTDRLIEEAAAQAGDAQVVCALSGGVDSTVVAVILHKAIGSRLHCIFVDHGLLRKNEAEEVTSYLNEHFDLNVKLIRAQDRFLDKLEGVSDPEKKRQIIGHTFIDVFEEEAKKIKDVRFLAQGTIWPDVLESLPKDGKAVVKSHHNVAGLPEKMGLALIEPVRELFKGEVREVGKALGLPDFIVNRHPFPGPGIGVRVLGAITRERLDILREADAIVREELMAADWYYKIWQGFAILLPMQSTGVRGDARAMEHVIALRIVDSKDAMTADWVRLPHELTARIAGRILEEVKGVGRVVYDVSTKPPSTIEWE